MSSDEREPYTKEEVVSALMTVESGIELHRYEDTPNNRRMALVVAIESRRAFNHLLAAAGAEQIPLRS